MIDEVEIGDIIQLTESALTGWVGCVMVVSEVKSWGVMAYMKLPLQGDTFLRVKFKDFEVVGHAVLVHPDHNEKEE